MVSFPEKIKEILKNSDNKKLVIYVFHTLYIISYFVIFVPSYNYTYNGIEHLLTKDIFEIGLISFYTYILYFLIIRFRQKKYLMAKAASVTLMLLSLVYLSYLKSLKLHASLVNAELNISQYELDTLWVFEFFGYIGFGTILGVIFYVVQNYQVLFFNRVESLKQELKEAKGQIIRQQFSPHFLFNALNSIYSMSLNNNQQTSDVILKLSTMMRYLTDEASVSIVGLAKELKFIEEYIGIEKIRFGADANIKFDCEGNLHGLLIEPMTLVVLVENAFKHGFYTNNKKSFVRVNVAVVDRKLTFSVVNSIVEKKHFDTERKGRGLEILKNMLNLQYPKSHSLELTQNDDSYNAILTIDLK